MKQYLDLLKAIAENGTQKPAARLNMPGSTSLFGYQFRHDLADGFPLLTTKKMFWKGIVIELLWFLRGDTNIKYLVDNGVNIWNGDAYNYYLKKCKEVGAQEPLPIEWFMDHIKDGAIQPGTAVLANSGYQYGDCGHQYGKVWRNWQSVPSIDQIANVIKSLKENPESRRHIVTAVDPAHDQDLALYWCHSMFQFNCRPIPRALRQEIHGEVVVYLTDEELDKQNAPKYYLDCQLYQRSADSILGVPFNIASYALLTHIVAKMVNMVPGEFIHSFGDAHIYDNHKPALLEQLMRTPTELPELKLFERSDRGSLPDHFEKYLTGRYSLDDFFNSLTYQDFKLEGYTPQPAIKADLSTG